MLSALIAVQAQQGIKGQVFWLGGNQMPSPDRATAPTLGVQREILVYQLTTLRDVKADSAPFYSSISTTMVSQIKTRMDGSFKIKLPPGEYSLFIKESKGLFANSINSAGEINKLSVLPKKYTWITVTIDYEAFY